MSDEIEIKQMSKTDFYQLSYIDCLPNKGTKKTYKTEKKIKVTINEQYIKYLLKVIGYIPHAT